MVLVKCFITVLIQRVKQIINIIVIVMQRWFIVNYWRKNRNSINMKTVCKAALIINKVQSCEKDGWNNE